MNFRRAMGIGLGCLLGLFLVAGALAQENYAVLMDKAAQARDFGQYDQAIENYTKALKAAPEDRPLDRAEALDQRGMVYELKKDYERALKDYDQAVGLAKGTPNAGLYLVDRARARLWLKDYDQAITDCNQALEGATAKAEAYYLRGVAWEKKWDLEAAARDFQAAVAYAESDAQKAKYQSRLDVIQTVIKKGRAKTIIPTTTTTTTTTASTLAEPVRPPSLEESDLPD